MVSEERTAVQLKVRLGAASSGENPFERERVDARSVGGVGALKDDEGGHGIDGVLEAPAQEAGTVRRGQDPAIAQTGVPYRCVLGAARHGIAAARPDFEFMAAFFGTILRGRK